jgi:hypothetical protein
MGVVIWSGTRTIGCYFPLEEVTYKDKKKTGMKRKLTTIIEDSDALTSSFKAVTLEAARI